MKAFPIILLLMVLNFDYKSEESEQEEENEEMVAGLGLIISIVRCGQFLTFSHLRPMKKNMKIIMPSNCLIVRR